MARSDLRAQADAHDVLPSLVRKQEGQTKRQQCDRHAKLNILYMCVCVRELMGECVRKDREVLLCISKSQLWLWST